MIRLALGVEAVLALAIFAGGASAAAPQGPRLLYTRFDERPTALQIITSDQDGSRRQVIAGGSERVRPLPMLLEAPQWSPDGSQVVFSGITPKPHGEGAASQIYIAAADGGGLHAVPGTEEGRSPIFAPDGSAIAFARTRRIQYRKPGGVDITTFRGATTWIIDANGENPRQLTPWRNGLEIGPSSFSPDGRVLALSRSSYRKRLGPEVVAMNLDGSGSTVLARNASDAVYSPDGSELALLRFHARTYVQHAIGHKAKAGVEETSDLFVIDADGSHSRRLTSTPKKVEVWPSWDPSGRRLAYLQLNGGSEEGLLGFSDTVMQINADGSCDRKVISQRGIALYGTAWQPGAGRAAGPIVCAGAKRAGRQRPPGKGDDVARRWPGDRP